MLIVLCGLPGSGKTTFATQLLNILRTERKQICYLLSLDTIYSELASQKGEKQFNSVIWKEATRKLYSDAKSIMKDRASLPNSSIILDDNNHLERIRTRWINLARFYGHHSLILYFQCSLEDAFNRNKLRKDPVPDAVITSMFQLFESPSAAEAKQKLTVSTISLNSLTLSPDAARYVADEMNKLRTQPLLDTAIRFELQLLSEASRHQTTNNIIHQSDISSRSVLTTIMHQLTSNKQANDSSLPADLGKHLNSQRVRLFNHLREICADDIFWADVTSFLNLFRLRASSKGHWKYKMRLW